MPVIGFLRSTSPRRCDAPCGGVPPGPAGSGFVEGQNVAIEYRWAEGRSRSTAGAGGRSGSSAGGRDRRDTALRRSRRKAATRTIPIVFATGSDPVRAGLVASLNRPGGNVTGVIFITGELGAKRLELLRELVPKRRDRPCSSTRTSPEGEAQSKRRARPRRGAIGQQLHRSRR